MANGTLASEFLRDFDDEVPNAVEGEPAVKSDDETKDDLKESSVAEREAKDLRRQAAELKSHIRSSIEVYDDGTHAEDGLYEHLRMATEVIILLDGELEKLTRVVRELYRKRLPELESIIVDSIPYLKTVGRIGNLRDISDVKFGDYLSASTEMVLKLSVSNSVGTPLGEEEMECTAELCDLALSLDEDRVKIRSFIERHLNELAPNLSVICDPPIAARLLGASGGLNNLWKFTSSSLLNLGTRKDTQSGYTRSHKSILDDAEIVLNCPLSLRKKALKEVAAKCILAARVDAFQRGSGSDYGSELRNQIEAKIKKWQEKPPPKQIKPLPAPSGQRKNKRGGSRRRKQQAKYEMTELMRLSKRVAFGKQEETDAFTGKGFGMLSSTEMANKVRLISKNNQELGKAAQRRLMTHKKFQKERDRSLTAKLKEESKFGGSTTVSFSTVQGMELENPNADSVRKGLATPTTRYFQA